MLTVSAAARNAEVNQTCAMLDGGLLRLYEGRRPRGPEESVEEQRLLVELRFSSPAFLPAKDGVAQALPLTQAQSAERQGRPGFFRCFRSDGRTAVMDGKAGAGSDADLVLERADIYPGAMLDVTEFVYGKSSKGA